MRVRIVTGGVSSACVSNFPAGRATIGSYQVCQGIFLSHRQQPAAIEDKLRIGRGERMDESLAITTIDWRKLSVDFLNARFVFAETDFWPRTMASEPAGDC